MTLTSFPVCPGYTHDHDCMYINGTGVNTYEFYIQLNRCGTLGGSDHHKREVKNRTPTVSGWSCE